MRCSALYDVIAMMLQLNEGHSGISIAPHEGFLAWKVLVGIVDI